MCTLKITFYEVGVNIMKKQTIKRQFFDYLLTDLLPYEKGNHFTHTNLYNHLLKVENKKEIQYISNEIKSFSGKFFDSDWHSSPLNFFTTKRKTSFRNLSFINPLGLIESLLFIDIFQNDILNILKSKKHFSVRIPYHNNNLYYKNTEGNKVNYSHMKDGKQFLIALESSGDYFKHRPNKTITNFLNGKLYNDYLNSFDYLLKIDIQNFFDSIYTHSYKWFIASKTYDSKKMKDASSIFSNIDTFLQNLNGSKTNGILIGPELFRLLAEFLLVQIDELLINTLHTYNYSQYADYNICRYVDDYFIFTNDKQVEKNIRKELEYLLNQFQLSINEKKIVETDTSINDDSVWLVDIFPITNSLLELIQPKSKAIEKTIKDILDELSKEIVIKESDFLEKTIMLNLEKNGIAKTNIQTNYQVLRSHTIKLLKSTEETALITSYILSTALRQLENSGNVHIALPEKLIQYLTFIYSHNITYDATQKMIQIFKLLINSDGTNKTLEYISSSLDHVSRHLITAYNRDWIDLLLFISSYQIPIKNQSLIRLKTCILAEKDPVNIAAFAVAIEAMDISGKIKMSNEINEIISHHVNKINWDKFREDEWSWWVFIFYSYPRLKSNTKKLMKDNLISIQRGLSNRHLPILKRRAENLQNEIENLDEMKKQFELEKGSKSNPEISMFYKEYNQPRKRIGIELREIQKKVDDGENLSSSESAMLLILNFLLQEKEHFIEWSFSKENYHEKFYFYTTDRTKFNPRGSSNNLYK